MNATSNFTIKQMSPQLPVADINRAIEFYTNQLGFDISFRYEDFYCGIAKDGYSIHLKSGQPNGEERKSKRRNENLDLVFSVAGIDHLYENIKNKPVEITQTLRQMPYGREFYIADPDGYIIGFIQEG